MASAFMSVAAASSVAMAQEAQATAAGKAAAPPSGGSNGAVVEEVVVTASRVERAGFVAPTPTTVVGAEEFQKTGATSIGGLLNRVPQFQGSATPTSTTLGDGLSNGQNRLDLRGLGAQRTLVLVDGQRFVPTNSDGSIDTNLIPSALIDRIEVVTGGASASWGSDAVAGVVNLILKKNFNGFEASAQSGVSGRGDNVEWRGTLAYGTGFADGRGHFEISGEAVDNNGVLKQSSRPWGARGYQLIANPGFAPGNGQYQELIASDVHLAVATKGGLFLFGPPGVAMTQFAPGGVPVPFNPGTYWGGPGSLAMVGGDGFNPGGDIQLSSPFDRQVVYSRVSYDFSPQITGYLEGSYGHTHVVNRNSYAPTTLGDVLITADNVYLPASIRSAMVATGIPALPIFRYSTDFGFSGNKGDKEVSRIVGGLDGKLGIWTWKTSYGYGVTESKGDITNDLIAARLAEAADAVASPVDGSPICRSTLSHPGNGCLPINLFGEGSPSAAAVARVLGTSSVDSRLTQQAAAATLSGEPFSTWAGPVSIATGLEYRRESIKTTSDDLSQADAFQTGNAKPLRGSYEVSEGFLETVTPLLSDLPFAKQLDLTAAVRYAHYSTSGGVTTWKVGLSYEVNDELRFRATRSRDIRAPNLAELFQAAELRFTSVLDPATGKSVTIQSLTEGNPDLQVEEADTTSVGVIYQPRWLSGFRASVDYYDINLAGAISTLTPQDLVNRCAAGNTQICNYVHRDGSGALTGVTLSQLNLGRVKTSGVDFEAMYVTPVGPGTLTARLLSTYVAHLTTDDGVTSVDHAGDVGADLATNAIGGIPHWRVTGSATYDQGPYSFYLAGRYIGGGKYDHTASIQNNDIDGVFYVDASAQYTLERSDANQLQLYLAVNNLFDNDPPIAPSSFFIPIATNPALYDVIGRSFTAGVKLRF